MYSGSAALMYFNPGASSDQSPARPLTMELFAIVEVEAPPLTDLGDHQVTKILLSIALVTFIATGANAESGDAYKVKKAECQARAKTMNFGLHFVKRNRWVNDCIAGRHAP
jgi:hypothetical protein